MMLEDMAISHFSRSSGSDHERQLSGGKRDAYVTQFELLF